LSELFFLFHFGKNAAAESKPETPRRATGAWAYRSQLESIE
jgi:hypothetical protein